MEIIMRKPYVIAMNRKSILFFSILFYSMMLFMTSESFTQPPPPPQQPPCLPDCFDDQWQRGFYSVPLNKPGCNSCNISIDFWYRFARCRNEYDFQITALNLSSGCIRCMEPDFNIMSLYGWVVPKLTKHIYDNIWNFPDIDTCVINWRMAIIVCWTKWTQYHYINTHMPREQWIAIDSFIVVNPCPISELTCCFKKIEVCHYSANDSISIKYIQQNHQWRDPKCGLNTNGFDCHWMCDFELEPPFFENGEEPPLKMGVDKDYPKELNIIFNSGNVMILHDAERKGDFTIDIYDLKGALIHKGKGNVLNDTKFDLQNLTKGGYFYRIIYEDGFTKSASFLIE